MKIRNGFVSNSSSSSFIINGKIDKVAKSMLKTVVKDYSSWNDKPTKKEKAVYDKWAKNLEIALKSEDVKNGKVGITMPSCNYETYIIQVKDQVYVSTCRNHEWDLDCSTFGGGADDGEDDIAYEAINSANFFNVRNHIIHSKERYSDKKLSCPSCIKSNGYYYGNHVVSIDGKILCGTCYEEIKSK